MKRVSISIGPIGKLGIFEFFLSLPEGAFSPAANPSFLFSISESFPFGLQSSPYTSPFFLCVCPSTDQSLPDLSVLSVYEEESLPQRRSAPPGCTAEGMPLDSPHLIPDRYFSQIRVETPIPELPPVRIPENHIRNAAPTCNPELGFEMHSCTDAPSSDDVQRIIPNSSFY